MYEEKIVELYKSGLSLRQIASIMGKNHKTILFHLKKKGIARRPYKLFDKKAYLIKKYENGASIRLLSRETGYTQKTLSAFLNRNGINKKPAGFFQRKYRLRENFFDNIDNEQKSYFLGFLYADGTNSDTRIELELVSEDKDILEKLSKLVYIDNRPIKTREHKKAKTKTRATSRLVIENRHICEELSRKGCPRRKTHIITFPKFIDPLLLPHFIRGYMDGDGSILIRKSKKKRNVWISVRFGGNPHFIEGLALLLSNISVNYRIYFPKAKNKSIVLSIPDSYNSLRFLSWIYDGSTIFLKRKRKRYDIAKNYALSNHTLPSDDRITFTGHPSQLTDFRGIEIL